MTFTGFTGSNLPALLDDFNRADNAVLGDPPWHEGDAVSNAGCAIVSNQVAPSAAGLQVATYRGIATTTRLGFAYTIAVFDSTAYAAVALVANQGTAVNPIEFFFVAANSIEVWYDNSSFKGTMALSASFASGDQIGWDISRVGSDNVYTCYRRAAAAGSWAQVGTFTDTGSARSGPWDPGIGFILGLGTGRYDDFYAEAITDPVAAARRVAGWIQRTSGGR